MKIIVSIVFFNLILFCYGQSYIVQIKPTKEGKFWGYADEKGNILIEPKYLKCSEFSSNGYATIYDTDKQKYSFIDKKGNELKVKIEKFTMVKSFSIGIPVAFANGLVPISTNEGKTWGYLGIDGNLAIDEKFNEASNFHDGFALAKIGTDYYFIDKDKNLQIISDKSHLKIKKIMNGFAPFQGMNEMWGFLNPKGEVSIEAKFKSVGYFSNELAWAKNQEGKAGFINSKGEWIIEPIYEFVKDFDPVSGLAKVKKGENWGFINTKGDYFTCSIGEDFGEFHDGLCWVRKGKLIGFVNAKMEWVIEPKFLKVKDFCNGFCIFFENEKWGIMDKNGSVTCQPKFDAIKDEIIKLD